MKIVKTQPPIWASFSISDVAPRIEGGRLVLTEGKGERHSWGRSVVTTTVLLNQRDFVAVHVGFHHKHRGGQGYFYFVRVGAAWTRKTWNQLTVRQQAKVIAHSTRLPNWAKAPGKIDAALRAAVETYRARATAATLARAAKSLRQSAASDWLAAGL
jgi:hypothetical protein